MKTRCLVVAGTIASTLAIAGCKQEAKAPEPVRPVAVGRPATGLNRQHDGGRNDPAAL